MVEYKWLFFFFKQKTAYEMRVSDWSSDVCSSDLAGPLSDTLGARFAYKIVKQDGYIYNRATDHDDPETKKQLARLTLRWEPSASFDYTLKAEYGNTDVVGGITVSSRSEEHTSELQSLMRISYAVFCLKQKKKNIR